MNDELAGAVLCPMPRHASRGYAWVYIQRLCAHLADAAAARGRRTYVAYPRLDGPPAVLAGSAAVPVQANFYRRGAQAVAAQCRFLREHDVRTLYLSDVDTFDVRYAAWRAAGVQRIVAHSHGSGFAPPARGWRRALKQLRAQAGWALPDVVVTVSDYVAARERAAALTPPHRLRRVWNAVPLPDERQATEDRVAVRAALGIAPEATVIAMTSRAAHEKGVGDLIRAVDRVVAEAPERDVHLVFVGGGSDLDEFRALAASLPSRERLHLVGPQPSSAPYLAAADIVAAPSVYQEALGLAVLEGLTFALPVVGTTVGGIPEVVRDGQEGLLVPPSDPAVLAAALLRLVRDPAWAAELGRAGRQRAAEHFDPARMLATLSEIVLGADPPGPDPRRAGAANGDQSANSGWRAAQSSMAARGQSTSP